MLIGGGFMGKANLYYLVGRDKVTNKYDVVYFDGKLESIDLYTTDYKNESELAEKLYADGKIKSKDVDLYIVSPKNDSIATNEVLYSRNRYVKNIARDSINKNLGFDNNYVNSVIYEFCTKMENNSKYYNMVVYGNTDIYPKFTEYFIGRRYQSTYDVKYRDGGWATKSYLLLRNILESYDRFDNPREDYLEQRTLLEKSLLQRLDKNSSADQLFLFDIPKFREQNISDEDKLIEIMDVFDRVLVEDFVLQNNRIFFDGDKRYGEDLDKLRNMLGDDLNTQLGLYVYHKYNSRNIDVDDDKYFYYKSLIRNDKFNIVGALSSDSTLLSNAYEWIKLYTKHNSNLLGDENGYQRTKKDTGGQ